MRGPYTFLTRQVLFCFRCYVLRCLDVLADSHVLFWMLRGIFFFWVVLSDGSSYPKGRPAVVPFGVVELGVTTHVKWRF